MRENTNDIHKWLKREKKMRLRIATKCVYNNTKCPICGKEINIKTSANGMPLTRAKVCNECDRRYVYTFRISPLDIDHAPKFLETCIDAELLIEFTNRINSLAANQSDVE